MWSRVHSGAKQRFCSHQNRLACLEIAQCAIEAWTIVSGTAYRHVLLEDRAMADEGPPGPEDEARIRASRGCNLRDGDYSLAGGHAGLYFLKASTGGNWFITSQ